MMIITGIVIGSLLSLLSNAVVAVFRWRHQAFTLKTSILAEVTTIEAHARHSERAIGTEQYSKAIHLRMAYYGKVFYLGETLLKVGNLDADLLRGLLSLAMRVRNDDIHIEAAIKDVEARSDLDLLPIRQRLTRTASLATQVCSAISDSTEQWRPKWLTLRAGA